MNKCSCNPYMNHNSYHVFFTNLANPLKIGIILELRKGDKNEQPKKQDNARRNKSDEKTHSGNIAINMLPRQDKHSQLPKRANL